MFSKITDEKELKKLREEVLKWISKKPQKIIEEPKKEEDVKKLAKIKTTLLFKRPPAVKSKMKEEAEEAKKVVSPKVVAQIKAEIEKKSKEESPLKKTKAPYRKLKFKLFFKIILAVFILIILLIVGFGIGLYQYHWRGKTAKAITKFIPYPVLIVNNKILTYYQFQEEVTTLINFYNQQVQLGSTLTVPPLEKIEDHIIERMIKNEIVFNLAKKYNLEVTPQELDEQIQEILKVINISSIQDLEKILNKLYNWGLEDFKEKVLKPLIIWQKLQKVIILDESLNKESLEKIKKIREEAKAEGTNFAELAEKYSEDVTSSRGGDLGYFGKGQMIKEFEDVVFSLEAGEISDVVKTSFGYHLVKLEEKIKDESGEVVQVHASHILIRGKDLETYVNEVKEKTRIWQFMK